jgi:hypothetical protein
MEAIQSSGLIGCPPIEIEVTESFFEGGKGMSYQAKCDNKIYFCSFYININCTLDSREKSNK